jgi:hypothetical protein
MRTKTLLLTAALVAVGAASSMAQVYSVNAVGYVNVTIKPGFNLIANPLVQTVKTLEALIPNPPDQTVYYKFSYGTGYSINTFDLSGVGAWDPNPAENVDLGGGGFLLNPTASAFTVTFVGDVAQGTLTNPVGVGFNCISSKVPQAGTLTDLGYTPVDGEVVYTFDAVLGYTINTYDLSGVGGWDPAEPAIAVGEAFFASSPSAHPWTRAFSVN